MGLSLSLKPTSSSASAASPPPLSMAVFNLSSIPAYFGLAFSRLEMTVPELLELELLELLEPLDVLESKVALVLWCLDALGEMVTVPSQRAWQIFLDTSQDAI